MTSPASALLKPRKTPRQARATVTVDAIFVATVQLLLAEGASRLTTTRIARRAGVSVGTMYQYFPNKQALLYALLQQELGMVVDAMLAATARLDGQSLDTIAEGLAHAWLDAKTKDITASRALYAVSTDFDIVRLIEPGATRIRRAIEAVIVSAPDARIGDPEKVAATLATVLGGSVRHVLERDAPEAALAVLRAELPILCRAYLAASSTPRGF